MKVVTVRVGALQARVLEVVEQPTHLAILCHGFGAPGTDLVGLGAEWLASEPALHPIRFVFPEGPLTLPQMPGARAWWQIDMEDLERALAEGRQRNMATQNPPGLAPARQKLRALAEGMMQQMGIGWDRVFLGGFSQGAMLTTDLSLRLEEAPAGLMILSGTLLSETEWSVRAAQRAGLSVFQSHGRQDPILAFSQAVALRALLDAAKLRTEFHAFEGEHAIPNRILAQSAAWLKARLGAGIVSKP